MQVESRNRTLRIAVIIDPPAVMECALEPNCTKRGIVYDIAQVACDKLNIDCVFIPANTTIYGHAENGTWLGVVADVASGRVDTSLPRFTPTEQRDQVIDFSSSYFYEELLLVTRQSKEPLSSGKLDLINAFDWYIWLCITFVMIVAAAIMSDTIMFKRPVSITDQFIRRFYPFLSFFGKYLTIWMISLVAVVLTRSYTGYLFSQRVSVGGHRPFTDLLTFSECVKTKRCILAVSTGMVSYVQELVEANGSSHFTHLKSALEVNPIRDYGVLELFEHMQNDSDRFITALIWDTDFYYATNYQDSCFFYILPAAILPGPNTFPLAKNSSVSHDLDLLAAEFNEYGLIKRIKQNYDVIEKAPCQQGMAGTSVEGDSLPFLKDVFLFFVAGIGLAVLCLCVERVVKRLTVVR